MSDTASKSDATLSAQEKSEWGGRQRGIGNLSAKFEWKPFAQPFEHTSPWAQAVLISAKLAKNRFGVTGSFMPGCPQVVCGLTEGMSMVIVPIASLINEGFGDQP